MTKEITKEEILSIVDILEQQIEYQPFVLFGKKGTQYILDLITRDWKSQGHMRKPYQVRNEMEHQKKLLSKNVKDIGSTYLSYKYEARIHFASWVLGDSDSF